MGRTWQEHSASRAGRVVSEVSTTATHRAGEIAGADDDRAARLTLADLDGRRDALRIRPLIEHPALRRALGLDVTADRGLPRRHAGTHRTPGMASSTPAPSFAAAAPSAPSRVRKPGRRFDRRALLDSVA